LVVDGVGFGVVVAALVTGLDDMLAGDQDGFDLSELVRNLVVGILLGVVVACFEERRRRIRAGAGGDVASDGGSGVA
jgi:uncharacterized membrane protein YadS